MTTSLGGDPVLTEEVVEAAELLVTTIRNTRMSLGVGFIYLNCNMFDLIKRWNFHQQS
jgi:hypothetical protein